MTRISSVRHVQVRSMLFSSMLQVGDNVGIDAESDVLAIQRQIPRFRGDEGDLKQIPIFSQVLPEPEIDEAVTVHRLNRTGLIAVGSLDILGISVASVLQIGSNRVIRARNRTKHIRQLLPRA